MDDLVARIAGLAPPHAALLDAMLADAAGPLPSGDFRPRAVAIRPGGDKRPLFFVHGAGGRVLFLHGLARALPACLGLWGLEAAISEELGADGCGDVVDRYIAAVRDVQPRGPYRLGAYSAGALIAFEMARRLERAGERIAMLLFIDPICPPHAAESRRARDGLGRRFELARLAGVTPLSPEFAMIHRVDRELSAIADAFRAVPIAAPLSVVRATIGDDALTAEGLLAWAELGGGLVSATIQADHFSIVREPAVADVAALLGAWIADDDTQR